MRKLIYTFNAIYAKISIILYFLLSNNEIRIDEKPQKIKDKHVN